MASRSPAVVLGRQIEALRTRLGSIEQPLSYGGLARELTRRLNRKPPIASSTVYKWEQAIGGSPDPWALVELARLAETTVEEFVYPQRAPTEAQQREIRTEMQMAETSDEAAKEGTSGATVVPIATARGDRDKSRASGAKAKRGRRPPSSDD